jgi:hypothetical protein
MAVADINAHSKQLEALADDVSITYQQVDGRMGVSGRDFVNGRLKKAVDGGAVLVVRVRAGTPHRGRNTSSSRGVGWAAPRFTTRSSTRTSTQQDPCAASTTTRATSSPRCGRAQAPPLPPTSH